MRQANKKQSIFDWHEDYIQDEFVLSRFVDEF